jgi:hypothetical protein
MDMQQTNKINMFTGEIEWETSELEGDISELPVSSAAVGGTGSVLMLEGTSVPALGMDPSSGENYLALTVPHGEVVVVSSPDSEYNTCSSMGNVHRNFRIKACSW